MGDASPGHHPGDEGVEQRDRVARHLELTVGYVDDELVLGLDGTNGSHGIVHDRGEVDGELIRDPLVAFSDHLDSRHLADALESSRFKQFLDHVPFAVIVAELRPSDALRFIAGDFADPAVLASAGGPFDVVLLDLSLPVIDGLAAGLAVFTEPTRKSAHR